MGRQMSLNGPSPLTPQDILAYQELHGVRFSAWELEVIEEFDAVALDAMHSQQQSKK